jgi:hypothetical protein
MIKLKRSSQLIGQYGQFGSAVCKQPEKQGIN